ncbi:MAG: HPF/RaiA family ribosome-associated protein [Fibrobacter sp.]|nr:HPF/RaiA family ribosome-associated protein [Fibrobacter sp.]
MEIPIEITFKDVEKTPELEELILGKARKLNKICDYIISCRVMVGKMQGSHRSGQAYSVRIDLKIPPGHELAISREPTSTTAFDVSSEVRWAFEVAARQLKELMEKQRGDIKYHEFQNVQGVIERIIPEDEMGFIRTTDGREIYFHRNSLLHTPFENLKIGMGVRFSEEIGEKGPQASSVQVVNVPESF